KFDRDRRRRITGDELPDRRRRTAVRLRGLGKRRGRLESERRDPGGAFPTDTLAFANGDRPRQFSKQRRRDFDLLAEQTLEVTEFRLDLLRRERLRQRC